MAAAATVLLAAFLVAVAQGLATGYPDTCTITASGGYQWCGSAYGSTVTSLQVKAELGTTAKPYRWIQRGTGSPHGCYPTDALWISPTVDTNAWSTGPNVLTGSGCAGRIMIDNFHTSGGNGSYTRVAIIP
jgi:hypothetical protein